MLRGVLGIAILIHPFPVIFVSMAIALYHLIWLAHRGSFRVALTRQLPYLAAVYAVGAAIGAHYWVPAYLNLKYASPIYTMTEYMWPDGMAYVILLCSLAIIVGIIARIKIKGDIRLDFLMACLILATAMGVGATRYFPFGLGVLLHEFRFATIMAPLFAVLLIVFILGYGPAPQKGKWIIPTFAASTALVALVFIIERPNVASLYLTKIFGASSESFRYLAQFVHFEAPGIIILVVLSFWILLAAASLVFPAHPPEKTSRVIPASTAVCLILLTSVVPIAATYDTAALSRLFTYVQNYETPEYAQIMERAKDSRLIVSMVKGSLCEGDSPVTFGWQWGVETVNGPYSQGDPKFFRHTVHLEWEDRWLDNPWTRENLMQESGAHYFFVRSLRDAPADMSGVNVAVSNSYGKLIELQDNVFRAANVTPVLLDVQNPDDVSDFFNIMVPGGYRLVFVDAATVPASLADKFQYVLTDDETKLLKYNNKQAFLLRDYEDGVSTGVTDYPGVTILKLPYLNLIKKYLYHGDQGNGMAWVSFDSWKGSKISPEETAMLKTFGDQLSNHLNALEYQPVGYHHIENTTALATRPGFTLVKDTYFPYWSTAQGNIIQTSQGFTLVYSDASNVTLNYRIPAINTAASAISIVSFLGVALALLLLPGKEKEEKKE